MPLQDSGLENAVTGEFDNDEMRFVIIGINAVNGDTLLQHTKAVDTENMDKESSGSNTDEVFFENTANVNMPIDNLAEELKKWIIGYNIKHNAADALLKILRDRGHKHLPFTAKTLLKTDPVESQMASGVECVQFGVTEQLIMCLNRYPYNYARDIIELEISLNVDGLPLFKSTGKSFWPVLCTVHLKPASTFPLAIALTEAKPKSLDFIKVIADELNMILMNGFSWGETTVTVRLRCITCDAPAKAMLKCIKQFSGYYGCDKCPQKGNWEGRMMYQQVHVLILRDDVSFREQHQPEHHQENTVSPFSDLQIDMVKSCTSAA
ncbi:transposase domain-containing protein [Labeo rohita]|uniref:Transposase domain-containing protein n=1 Tax=Labeo rohita TaxID=84645 RepID=A0A498NN02_LABRO|nr:transposase domain-containing protein [Labeo rohita]